MMNEQFTFKELDALVDAMLIMRKQYPLSWSNDDENALRKIRSEWYKAYETERSNHGEEESWPEEPTTTERTV